MSRRRGTASIVASPALVGAVTILITVIAVFLAYNANQGLPFVPTLDVKVQARNGEAMTRGAEVREGGLRIGFVKRLRTVRRGDGAVAEMAVQIDNSAGEIPVDTNFTIRPRSPLGLKYLEMMRGDSRTKARDGYVFPPSRTILPVQFDDLNRTYDARTRRSVQGNSEGFGNALAGRGPALNQAIGNLPRFFGLVAPVTANLAAPRTRLGRFFRELGDAARVVAPIADIQADLFTRTALTFEAISRDPQALKETISRSHPAFQAGIDSFPVQRPFLSDSAEFAHELRPVARELRPTLPLINDALETGAPVNRRSVGLYRRLRPTLVSLRDLMRDSRTGVALRGLTANATTLKPQLRYLGPYQTVCNSWNYFFTFFGEHVSQSTPFGFAQRATIKSSGQQTNSPGSMGAYEPSNGQGYQEASRPRGDPVYLHATPYNAAIDDRGNADCENGQRGFVRRLARFSDKRFQIATDPHMPGNQGPTYKGRRRVPAGQTFTREPETGEKHE